MIRLLSVFVSIISVSVAAILYAGQQPSAVEVEFRTLLLKLQRLPHGSDPMEQGDPRPLAQLTEFTRQHPQEASDIVRTQLQRVLRLGSPGHDRGIDDIRPDTWFRAGATLPRGNAAKLMAEIFDETNRMLIFIDALYSQNRQEKVLEALGKEAYGEALRLINLRDWCLMQLTDLDSSLAVDGAKLMLKSEISARYCALKYLLSQADDHPEVRDFLIKKYREERSGVYMNPLLKDLIEGNPQPATAPASQPAAGGSAAPSLNNVAAATQPSQP